MTTTNTITYRSNSNFNSNFNSNHNHNHNSKKEIQLTFHSRDRAEERLGINSKNELRDRAASARFNGVNIKNVNINNYERFGITYSELVALKTKFRKQNNSEKMYYNKGYIYIFFGKNCMSLKTIIKLHTDDIQKPIF